MKTYRLLSALMSVATLGWLPSALGEPPAATSPGVAVAGRTFNLAGARSHEPQEFTSETRIVSFAPDGARGLTDIYRLRLKCEPAGTGSSAGDTITCLGFTVQLGSSAETEIPALRGLTYLSLATRWVTRVDADETVVSETTLPMPPNKVNAIIERTILIRNVSAPRM